MHELDNVVFTTKSVMLTAKQKDMISGLLDRLCDLGCDEFDNIEYQKLSRQDASKLIDKMLDKIEYLDYLEYGDYDPLYDCGDR